MSLTDIVVHDTGDDCTAGFFGCGICKEKCVLALVIAACVDSVLLPLVGMFAGKENELKASKQQLCAEKRVGGIHGKLSEMEEYGAHTFIYL